MRHHALEFKTWLTADGNVHEGEIHTRVEEGSAVFAVDRVGNLAARRARTLKTTTLGTVLKACSDLRKSHAFTH